MRIILVNGKDPMRSTGGYQTYTYNLAKILENLGHQVKVVSFGEQDKIYHWGIWKNMETAGLIILGPLLAVKVYKEVKNGDIVWGIGSWSLAVALVKIFKPKIKYFSFYPVTFKHELWGNLQAVEIKDYGWKLKLEAMFAYYVIAQIYTFLEAFFLFFADKIVVHYQSAVEILHSQFGIAKARISVIPDYMEEERTINL